MTPKIEYGRLHADEFHRRVGQLGALLRDCVHAGASIGFILPFEIEAAKTYWIEAVRPALVSGSRVMWIAQIGDRTVGTIQLETGTPANQPHRAEIMKLMVHPQNRRAGIARTLVQMAIEEAQLRGKTLLTLDTRTGDAAEPLYRSLEFEIVGIIPDYCLEPDGPRLDSTTVMYRKIAV